MQASLVSTQTQVESPFIILTIGQYTFGQSTKKIGRYTKVTFPNFMQSLNIKKINGSINTYTIKISYQITENDDPNMLEKVFSSISGDRKIKITYGDWMLPTYIYRDEEAMLTKVTSQVDFNNSKIDYTLTAVGTPGKLAGLRYNFSACVAKPSDIIKSLVKNKMYNLDTIFYGMKNIDDNKLSRLIVSDDIAVNLKAQTDVDLISYINYLVTCMRTSADSNTNIKQSVYYWASFDDITNEFGGPYFKVVRVDSDMQYTDSYSCYAIDIGYPSGNYVVNFSLNTTNLWSILYSQSAELAIPEYTYDIDSKGNIISDYSPKLLNSQKYNTATEATKDWWSKMTQFPLSATLTIKGLLKPALITQSLKVNTYFFGKKHISSGMYIINKQEDIIDSSGYRTILTLTRIKGDI